MNLINKINSKYQINMTKLRKELEICEGGNSLEINALWRVHVSISFPHMHSTSFSFSLILFYYINLYCLKIKNVRLIRNPYGGSSI